MWDEYVSQPDPEKDPGFVSTLSLSGRKGMLAAGILGLLSTSIYLLLNTVVFRRSIIFFVVDATPDDTMILWDKLVIVALSLTALILQRRKISIRRTRYFMSFAGLTATFTSLFDNLASHDWTAAHAYPALFMIAIVGTVPFKPLQALSLALAVMGLILGSEIALPLIFGIPDMGFVQSHVVYLIILSLMLAGMSIVLYKGRWNVYQLQILTRSHKRQLDRQHHDLQVLNTELDKKNLDLHDLNVQTDEQNRTLRGLNAQLKDLQAQRSTYFANISHEFMTPLTIMIGTVEDTLSGMFGKMSKELRREQVRTLFNASRLLDLVNQMLDLSRIERGLLQVKRSPGDLNRFLEELVDSFVHAAERKDLVLTYHGTGAPAWYEYDRRLVETVVRNLVGNAVKFSERGTIRVGLSVNRDSEHSVVNLSVQDQGIGIPPEDHERVFERLYRGEAGISEEGVGIGLAFVKEAAEVMGGTVHLESVVGIGSTFRVMIPVSDVAADAGQGTLAEELSLVDRMRRDYPQLDDFDAESEEKSEEAPMNTPIVAIVDDNQEIRELLRRRLRRFYRIVEAANGLEGLNVIRENRPEIVIADIMMPVMDGLKMLEAMKGERHTAGIPVIVLTADKSEEAKVRSIKGGAINHITKPFNQHHLLQLIANTLQVTRDSGLQQMLHNGEILVSEDDEFLERAKGIAIEHISDNAFSVDLFADLMHVSRRTLQRRLRTICGLSPMALVKDCRLRKSYELLVARVGSVADVAHRVGYRSASHFSQEFFRTFGNTPQDVRNSRQ